MTSEVLGLIQLGSKIDYSPTILGKKLTMAFPAFTVERLPPLTNPAEAYDSFRKQYHATRLLAVLEEHLRIANVDRLLGLSASDIFVPGMNYVFGEARCPGHAAVISTWRLKPKGQCVNRLFASRVFKEAVHEVGHMLGLGHCTESKCVMHFSESIRDTDKKHTKFCEACRKDLRGLRAE